MQEVREELAAIRGILQEVLEVVADTSDMEEESDSGEDEVVASSDVGQKEES